MSPVRFTKRHKYSAKRITIDGHRFDSIAESRRYGELKMLEKAGKVFRLQLQRRYRLCPWINRDDEIVPELGYYVADFVYCTDPDCICAWGCVVEDVKGVKTPLYKWKKRHFEAQYHIDITEVTA